MYDNSNTLQQSLSDSFIRIRYNVTQFIILRHLYIECLEKLVNVTVTEHDDIQKYEVLLTSNGVFHVIQCVSQMFNRFVSC